MQRKKITCIGSFMCDVLRRPNDRECCLWHKIPKLNGSERMHVRNTRASNNSFHSIEYLNYCSSVSLSLSHLSLSLNHSLFLYLSNKAPGFPESDLDDSSWNIYVTWITSTAYWMLYQIELKFGIVQIQFIIQFVAQSISVND